MGMVWTGEVLCMDCEEEGNKKIKVFLYSCYPFDVLLILTHFYGSSILNLIILNQIHLPYIIFWKIILTGLLQVLGFTLIWKHELRIHP